MLTRSYLGLGAAFTGGLLVFAFRFSTFVGDDLTAFWLVRTVSPGAYLTSLLGGQLVVLHRALTWLIYAVAPMKFWVALSILGAFHALGALFLYRTLESMKRSGENALLVGGYLMSVFVGLQFTWWSSGLTRVAYVAFALAAIHHYLAYARDGRPRHLAVVAGSSILSLGFYSMGILIPFYCAGADLCFSRDDGASKHRRLARWGVLVGLVGADVVYVLVARSLLPSGWERLNLAPGFLASFVLKCWAVLVAGLADQILVPSQPAPLLAFALFGVLAVYSAIRIPGSLRSLGALVVLVSANFLFLGVSSRTLLFGESVAFEHRHYFELWFLVVLFAGASVHRFGDTSDARWLQRHPRIVAASGGVLLLAHGALSTRALLELLEPHSTPTGEVRSLDELDRAFYSSMPESRAFLGNLQGDLRALAREGHRDPTFADAHLPSFLDPLDFTFRRHSQLFVVLRASARFSTDPAKAQYRVDDAGHVVHIGHP